MLKKLIFAGVLAATPFISASAAPMIVNGGFETTTYTNSTEFGPYAGFTQGVSGWTSLASPGPSGGFNVLWFPADVAANFSAPNRFGDQNDRLPNGAPGDGTVVASPQGGNFVALDGDTDYHGYLYQTITGLTPGSAVKVSFYWAGAQLLNRTGNTTDSLQVTLGTDPSLGAPVGETYTTAAVSVPTHGFSGWMKTTFTFTPISATEVLTFLSIGTPNGLPPVALLDGITIDIPEPMSLTMLATAMGILGIGLRRRKRS